jgi:hypothetical protein
MRDNRPASRVVLWFLIAAIGLPPSPAAAAGGRGQWSKVETLKPDTRVVVTFVKSASRSQPGSEPQEAVDGYVVWAAADALALSGYRSRGADARAGGTTTGVTIPRERIVEVAVVNDGRPWWAIPLFVAALAAGMFQSNTARMHASVASPSICSGSSARERSTAARASGTTSLARLIP